MVTKVTILNTLEPFLSRPREGIHLLELSRILNEPPSTIRKHLAHFEKLGIVKKQIKGRMTIFSLNFNNPGLFQYLFIIEKNKLIKKTEHNLKLKELFFFLNTNYSSQKYLIFGSFVDDSKKAQDIDLLFIGKIDKNKINDFSKKYNLNLHLIILKSLNLVSKSLKEEILKKHLIINNTEEFLRWLYG